MAAMKIEAKTKYALLGKISGSITMKFDKGTFSLKNTDKDKQTIELIITVIPGQSLSIEGKKNEISMRTYKTSRTNKHAAGVFEMNSDTKVSHMPILESFGMIDFKRPNKLKTRTG